MAMTADRSSIFVGLGAGLASAALVVSLAGGTTLAVPLSMLSALPIAIAALGWGRIAGLIAGGVGALVLGALLGPFAALNHLVTGTVPTLVAVHLIGLSRAVPAEARPFGGPAVEWYPLGRMLLALSLATAFGVIVVGVASGYDTQAVGKAMSEAFFEMVERGDRPLDPRIKAELEPVVRAVSVFLPAFLAISRVLVTVVNLWIAAHVVRKSDRLVRPWEDLAAIELPRGSGIGFLAAFVLAFAPSPLGLLALPFAGALFAAHFIVGLAVLHAATRGSGLRILVLAAVYGLIFLFTFPALLVAVVGLLEPFLGFRRRGRAGTAG